MTREKFNFSSGFEKLIVGCLVAYPEKFIGRGELLQPQFFRTAIGSTAVKAITEFQRQYSRIPSFDALEQALRDECAKVGIENSEIETYLSELGNTQVDDVDYVVTKVVDFCRERAIIAAIKEGVTAIKEGKAPKNGWTRSFEEALAIGQDLGNLGYMINTDVDEVVDKTLSPSFGVKTGIPAFDRIWRTGWAPGWLIVPLAPPKRYKTIFSLNLATSIAGQAVGGDVIYYACEISAELAAMRVFYGLANLTEDDLIANREDFKTRVKAALEMSMGGRLLVKHFPIGTARVSDIKAHARMAVKQLGLKPRAIIIDYADTVVCADTAAPQHIQQALVYKEVIALGKEVGACIIMPDRCTAQAVDKKVPDMKSFQGAFAKGGILDIAIGLCSTPAEYAENILRTFVFINRHGPAWQHFTGKVDPAHAKIVIGEEIPYNPDDEETEQESSAGGGRPFQRRRQERSIETPAELLDPGAHPSDV